MTKVRDPRQAFFAYLMAQTEELENVARSLSSEYIQHREEYRRSVSGRRALGLYIFVSRDKRTKRLSIEWRKSRYIDNSPLARNANGRSFAKTQHIHRCPRPDHAYTARNLAVATRRGEQWERDLVAEYEKRAVVLRRHAARLAAFQAEVAELPSVESLIY